MLVSDFLTNVQLLLGIDTADPLFDSSFVVSVLNQTIPTVLQQFDYFVKNVDLSITSNTITVPADFFTVLQVLYKNTPISGYVYKDYLTGHIADSTYFILENSTLRFPTLADGEVITLYYRYWTPLVDGTSDILMNTSLITALKWLVMSNYFLRTQEFAEHQLYYARYKDQLKQAHIQYNQQIHKVFMG